jgi:hypothetical protein
MGIRLKYGANHRPRRLLRITFESRFANARAVPRVSGEL